MEREREGKREERDVRPATPSVSKIILTVRKAPMNEPRNCSTCGLFAIQIM